MEYKEAEVMQNTLFKRKLIKGEIKSDVSPRNTEVLKLLSEKYGVPENTIKVRGIHGNFGSRTFEVSAMIYDSPEDLKSTEVSTKKEREAEKKAAEDAIKAEKEEKAAKAKTAEEAAQVSEQ